MRPYEPDPGDAGEGRNVLARIVIGGGVAGLTTAWRATELGEVHLFDGDTSRSASWVAGGMLAPVSEVSFTEEPLLRVDLAACAQWPAFAAEVEAASGMSVGFRTEGTIQVAFNSDDLRELDRLREFQQELGLDVSSLTADDVRDLEGHLSPHIVGGTLVKSDYSVDNRSLVLALRQACINAGVHFHHSDVTDIKFSGARATGVRFDGGTLSADQVVIANGSWSSLLAVDVEVRPVKGEIIRLQTPSSFGTVLSHTVRAIVRGVPLYLVPRTNGEIVIGATQLEVGYSTTPTAGGAYQLLRDARELLPISAEMEIIDISAGLRPGSPDNGPILGPITGYENLFLASGHYRNGILLSAITGDVMKAHLTGSAIPEFARSFTPSRFSKVAP